MRTNRLYFLTNEAFCRMWFSWFDSEYTPLRSLRSQRTQRVSAIIHPNGGSCRICTHSDPMLPKPMQCGLAVDVQ